MTPAPRRSRLRNRVVAWVGTLVAGVSLVVGVSTYYLVRDALLDEHERSSTEQFTTNARVLGAALRTDDVDEVALLASLRPDVRARELLFSGGEWFTASLQFQPSDLPPDLIGAVGDGTAAQQRFDVDGSLVVALGAPLSARDDLYFEVFSLDEVQSTLGTLRTTLVLVGSIAVLLGVATAAVIARRVATPLEEVGRAAAGIADGDLRTRLAPGGDEEVARIAESFNRMADSLEERIRRETRFTADVSHELRSPLTTLVNTVSVLERRRDELSPDAREALTLLSGDVTRFERMVTDLIEISKHDSGSLRIDLEDTSPEVAVTSTLRRLQRTEVPIRVTPAAASARVSIDPQRFERAFRNVVENADAYAGGVVEVSIDADDDRVRIVVDDAGPGVPLDERERIFDRFSRGVHGERRQTADGSGLGLSLARENMVRLDGSIRVDDRPGAPGARFTLTLPRAPA